MLGLVQPPVAHLDSAFVGPPIAVWVPMRTYLLIRTAKGLHLLKYLPCLPKSPLPMVICAKIEEISYLYRLDHVKPVKK